MPTQTKVGRRHIIPTTRGQIEWIEQPWGAEVFERVTQHASDITPNDSRMSYIRLPWSVAQAILNTRPVDV